MQKLVYVTILVASCIVGGVGCEPAPPPSVTRATVDASKVSSEPSEVELFKPKLTMIPPDLMKFEVQYKFTRGSPTKNYMCNLSFPGTDNVGRKPIEAWEMKAVGTIKGAIELQSPEAPVTSFEISLSEAEVPQSGYTIISNVLRGEMPVTVAEEANAAK